MRRIRPLLMILASLGIGLLAMVAAAQWLQQRSMLTTEPVVVAVRDLEAGTRLEHAMLEVVRWPKGTGLNQPLRRLDDAEGRALTSRVLRGEPLLPARLAPEGEKGGLSAVLQEGQRAVTVKVNEIVGVAGFALPGNYVDVMVHTTDSRNQPISRIVLERIQVLAVAQDVAPQENKPRVVNAVTLLVTPEQAERMDLARSVGTLSLVLRNQIDASRVSTQGARKQDVLPGDTPPATAAPATPKPRPVRTLPSPSPAPSESIQPAQMPAPEAPAPEVLRGARSSRS